MYIIHLGTGVGRHVNIQILKLEYRMQLAMSLIIVFLFVVLTPGILIRIPSKGSPLIAAVVHGLVFAAVLHFVQKYLHMEGFQQMQKPNKFMPDYRQNNIDSKFIGKLKQNVT